MDNPEAGSRPPTGVPGATGGQAEPRGPAPGEEPSTWPSTEAWPGSQRPPAYGYAPRRPTNGLAIAALAIGVISFVSCPLIGAVAVYLGNRARNEIRTTGEEGDSLALAGLIIGWCALALAALMALFAVAYFGFIVAMISQSGPG
jgi:hypothetical protein